MVLENQNSVIIEDAKGSIKKIGVGIIQIGSP
jgi:hypothetical protein